MQAGGALAAGLTTGLSGGPLRAALPKAGPGGFSPDGLKRITTGLQECIDHGDIVGVVTLLWRRGEVAQVNTLGWQDQEAKIAMRRDSIFRIASMSKPITGVATMMLVEEGKIGLHDPVTKWLPELADRKVLNAPDGPLAETHAAPQPITVADLLTHRSGILYDFTATGPLAAAIEQALPRASSNDLTPDEWLKRLATLPLAFDPGSRWNYGLSVDVLGVLIQRVSGTSFPDFLQRRIFEPLGMKDTGFWLPKDKLGRLAVTYGGEPGHRTPAPMPLPAAPPAFASGGGGLLSTADDYARFARMLEGLGKLEGTRLLSRQSVELMTTNWLTPEQRKQRFLGLDFWGGQGFGLTMSVVDDIARQSAMGIASKGAFGWPGAFGTWWQADPAEDMVMVYMVQNAAALGPRVTATVVAGQRPLMAFETLTYRAIDS